jgi:hypothetical protein
MSQLDFSIKNEYADIIIVCNDETELYYPKFILSKNKYFAGLFANNFNDSSKHCSIFSKDIMNIILNVYYDKNENILQYTDIKNAPILYEATNYYMMIEAHTLVINYIVNNINFIHIDPHFIELLYQYQDTRIINTFSLIKNGVSEKLTPLNNVLKQINLNVNIQLFLNLTKDVMIMDNFLYIYLLKTWISHYKDVDDLIIKNILNEHITKILSLNKTFYILYDYFKESSYIESFNYFKIETFDKVMELKNDKYKEIDNKYKEIDNNYKVLENKYKVLENKVKEHNKSYLPRPGYQTSSNYIPI